MSESPKRGRFHVAPSGEASHEDRLPPHALEAEQAVLGCALLAAQDCMGECIEKLKSGPTAFYDVRHQVLYSTLVEMHGEQAHVDLITVQQRLKDPGQLDAVGGRGYLTELPDKVASPAMVGTYLAVVWDKFILRRTVQTLSRTVEKSFAHNDTVGALVAGLARDVAELETLVPGEPDRAVVEFLAAREFRQDRPPEPVVPVFSLAGVPVCTAGNVSSIVAQIKSGKSAFVGAMIASAIAPVPERADTFTLRSANTHGRALVHLDTEQSQQDHDRLVRTALRRAGIDAPHWLHSIWCKPDSPRQRREMLPSVLAHCARHHGGIHSVILDGVADFVDDVNDPGESNDFVGQLHQLAAQHNCPIIGVLHLNPLTGKGAVEKSRGHLGSQLERKSESNIRLEKNGDVTQVFALQNRGAPIAKENGPCFRWSDQHGMHRSCDLAAQGGVPAVKLEQYRAELEAAFGERPGMRYGELRTALVELVGLTDSAARNRITRDYPKAGLITAVAGIYSRRL